MQAIKTDIVIHSVRSKVDKSLSLTVHTPELTSQQRAGFMELQGIAMEAELKPKDGQFNEMVEVEREIDTQTPSQRLRSVLYVLWKQQGEPDSFRLFYEQKMEKLIDIIKSQLEDDGY